MTMLQQTLMNIESAQVDVEIFNALKEGDSVLKDLQKQASMGDWEDLMDSHKENLEIADMEAEMFGAPLLEDDLNDELDALVAADAAKDLADLGPQQMISAADARKYR